VEAAALRAAGMTTEAVPGVAVEIAVPARAGIPVHVRHLAVTCTFAAIDQVPAWSGPTRTIVVTAGDLAATATALTARTVAGNRVTPAAAVPADDDGAATVRAPLGSISAGAPNGPGVLVVGAVCAGRADTMPRHVGLR